MANSTNSTNSTSAPSPLQNLTMRVDLNRIIGVTIVTKTVRSYTTDCINLGAEPQAVLCPIPNPSYRNVSSVVNVTYPYSTLHLAGYSTDIVLRYTGSDYSVNKTYLGIPNVTASNTNITLPANMTMSESDQQALEEQAAAKREEANRDPKIFLDTLAVWEMSGDTLKTSSLSAPKLGNVSDVIFSLEGQSCLDADATDTVYQLNLVFDAFTYITGGDSGISNMTELTSLAQTIAANSSTVVMRDGYPSFPTRVSIIANMILTKVNSANSVECPVQTTIAPTGTTSAPTPTPTSTPAPQFTTGISRYGILKDPTTGLNSIGKFYGFNNTVANVAFSYNNFDKYSTLIIRDNCFKVKIWIVIPAFFIIIVFPLWIDASILTAILGALATVLNTVTSTFLLAVNAAQELQPQNQIKTQVAYYKKAALAAAALTTEEGRATLISAAEDFAQKQLNTIETVANFEKLAKAVQAIEKIIKKINDLITLLSSNPLTNIASGQASGFDMSSLKPVMQLVKDFNSALNEILGLVDDLPNSDIKEKIKKLVKDLNTLLSDIKTSMITLVGTIQAADVTATVDKVINIILGETVVRQMFTIMADFKDILDMYSLLLDQLDQLGVKKAATELEEKLAKQHKTGLAQALSVLAEDLAAAVDGTVDAVADILQINLLNNLADEAVGLAVSAVGLAASGLNSAAEGIEAAKRDQIRGRMSSFLKESFDIYKVSRTGRFDENHPNEKQILINDLSGTRIYSRDGDTLLFSRTDFCKNAFAKIDYEIGNGGCQSGTGACGLGRWNCGELNYWYNIFKYRVSFDFYDNHDLSLGGVVIGDFDGDGIDDIMCHLPGSTKNYDQITKEFGNRTQSDQSEVIVNNEIIYSPLKSRTSDGRFQSKEQPMLVYDNSGNAVTKKDWCKDGVIRVGDFNGDKKDDLLCITLTVNYLLYSNGYTFRPANNTNGTITLPSLTSSSREFQAEAVTDLKKLVVVTGDFDGDGYSDLLNIGQTSSLLYFGDPVKIFVQNTTRANAWLTPNLLKLAGCYLVGENRIIVDDINNDGKDDIACVTSDNNLVNNIISTLNSTNNVEEFLATDLYTRVYINDVVLHPYDMSISSNAQQHIRVNYQNHTNKKGDGILISNDKMNLQQKSISDISVSLDCLNLNNQNSATYVSFSGEYTIPESLLWGKTENKNNLLLNLDLSAIFKGKDLAKLVSSEIQTFEYKLEVAPGGCYKSETVSHYITLTINYNATAKLVIENHDQLLQGKDLEVAAKNMASSFDIEDESIISFPVSGQIVINALGVGYDVVGHCE